jgi:hypothetical protein
MNYLIPRSFLTLEFGRQIRLADMGYDPGRGFEHHYQTGLPKLREIAEALILCPIVTLGIVGPNIQLPFLARYFGVKPLLQLLDDGAIEFKQITGSVALATEPDDTARLSPEPADRGPANSDPEAAARMGLDQYGQGISDEERRELIAKAAARTSPTRSSVPEDAIEIASERYAEDEWAFSTPARGDDKIKIERIRREVLLWATSYCHSAMIYDESYALLNERDDWTFAYEAAETCTKHTGIFDAGQQVLDKDGVLSLAELLRRGALVPADIPVLRNQPATDAFRAWLWGEVTDGRDAAAEWLKIRSVELDTGWLRKATIWALAVVKAAATAAAKHKFGVEDEATGIAIEIASDVMVDNAFDRVVSSLQLRNPRNFVHGLATVAGHRVIRSGGT